MWACIACPVACQERPGSLWGAEPVGSECLQFCWEMVPGVNLYEHLNFAQKTASWSNLKQSEGMAERLDNHITLAQIYLLWSPFYLAINVRPGKP